METLLLFAALFSAIVTAFVIESSQNLQPDNATITATAIVEIAAILRNRSAELPMLQSPEEFQPTVNAIIVNFAWFISLCMSITVALIAGLVKQWCNMLRWDRTAPPCNQARIRQARLNKLIRWRTELVISALPILMDAALGLFLLGLLVFLRDLSYGIYLAALVVTLCTMAFYLGTTIAPCFVSFCPYETAISSRKAWGFFYQLCLAVLIWIYKLFSSTDTEIQADLINYMSPCEKKEVEMASNTTPDRLTGDALNWIILHSQKPAPREMAIRAIATLESEEALEQLVSNPPGIIPQVIQSFTSRFRLCSTPDGETKLVPMDINIASLHGRALTVLVTQATNMGQLESHLAPSTSTQDDLESNNRLSKWVIDPTTREGVRIRLKVLGDLHGHSDSEAKAWGLVGLSAWHDFIGYNPGLRFDRGRTVSRLAKSLHVSLSPDLRTAVLQTLIKELSYWTLNVVGKYRSKTLSHLIKLIPMAPRLELRSQLACSLAVLALGLNHGTTYSMASSTSTPKHEAPGTMRYDMLAKAMAEHYSSRQKELVKDGHSLLLLALTGLMEYYEHCDFDEEASLNMKKIAKEFRALYDLGKQQSIVIPTAGGTNMTINPRDHFVHILVIYLKQPRTLSRTQDLDEVSTNLLKFINHKRQVQEFAQYGPQILPLVVQILARTNDIDLQTECLRTIESYWDTGPGLLYTRMLLFYQVLPKLVQMTKRDKDGQATSSILQSIISTVFKRVEKQAQYLTDTDGDLLVSCMGRILEFSLLGAFIDYVLNISSKIVKTPENSPENGSPSTKPSPVSLATEELYNKARVVMDWEDHTLSPGELFFKKLFQAFHQRLQEKKLSRFLAERAALRAWIVRHERSVAARRDAIEQNQAKFERDEVVVTVDEEGKQVSSNESTSLNTEEV
ncbi:hypothetical protein ACGC1H_007591 [Rhizoctonia solani]